MKETKDLRTNKGITLIALVITIIVMLILVGVTISMAVNGGLFDYAGKAVGETKNALNQEQQLINDIIDEYIKPNLPSTVELISKTESYVGYYADFEGDGEIDGVIYADLAFASEEDANWNGYSYSYSATPSEELKDYYVSGTHDGDFNEEGTPKEVLTPTGTGTKDRFYVMDLEDVTTDAYTTFFWYYNANGNTSDYETATTTAFGAGKSNTEKIKGYWDAETPYGTQEARDLWSQIDLTNGWFVPSIAEWDAFADAFDVSSVYDDEDNWGYPYGLSQVYWSSTLYDSDDAWVLSVNQTENFWGSLDGTFFVRLSATF